MSHNLQRPQRGNHKVPADLQTPVRNHYFYGKLLDVFHLELEQEYFNSKRWLHNRLITGPGVVCGLRVDLTDDGKSVVVGPGFAIDRCGREIIVAAYSKPYLLPDLPPYEPKQKKGYDAADQKRQKPEPERRYYCEIPFAHVVLCYHECESDPTPAMSGDCETVALCASGSVREQYSIEIRDGFAPTRESTFPRDVIDDGRINYRALVDYVTSSCRELPYDCCLPLANIELVEGNDGWDPEIDITIRPIVYTNRLLWELISSLASNEEAEATEV
jgi:hypothetical protein